jgi:hypothetical protein
MGFGRWINKSMDFGYYLMHESVVLAYLINIIRLLVDYIPTCRITYIPTMVYLLICYFVPLMKISVLT